MFGLVDRGTYDIRIFFVNNNRARDTLLPIVKKNVYTYYNSVINNHDPNDQFPATRIYSDCFLSYQENDFNGSGYILHRVNHSVWFGQGSFHTNNIEGVLSRVKRWTNNFSGINGKVLHKLAAKGINIDEYFNSWICFALFQMRCEHLCLAFNKKIELLAENLG